MRAVHLLLAAILCHCATSLATTSATTTTLTTSSTAVDNVSFGSISMQFQSQAVAQNAATFVQTLLATTQSYLNEYFTVYYSNGFQSATLQVQSFHVDTASNGYGTYAAQITFNGTAAFSANSFPTQDQVSNLLAYAFQQQNRQLYINKLLASPTETYLQQLTYFVVSINGFVISDGQQNGIVQNPAVASSNNSGRPVDWERVVIIACSVAGGILILACCIMVVFCCWVPKEMVLHALDRDHKNYNNSDTMERGIIGGTGPLKLSPRTMSYHHSSKKQPRHKSIHDENDNDDHNDDDDDRIDFGSTRSPSPVRSFVSQDSSNFTYNPRSKASLETRSTKTMMQIDVSNRTIDIEAWKNHQNNNSMISPVTPAPFGADISAIECTMPATSAQMMKNKKDLSLIEEDELKENESPSPQVIVTTTAYLTSKDTMLDRNIHAPKPSPSVTHASLLISPDQDIVMSDDDDDDVSTAHSDDSDVIRDLNKLSRQFDKYRGRR